MPTPTTPSPVLELPPLLPEEEAGLRASIARHGVLVAVLMTEDGRVIDGNNRRRIAAELGVPCPEQVQSGLSEEDARALARSLNLARRQLNRQQRRQLVADQLRETPGWSNRRLAQTLGVDHHTVAAVRSEIRATGEIPQFDRTTGRDNKTRPATRLATRPTPAIVHRPPAERRARIAATTLHHGDCRDVLPRLPSASVDVAPLAMCNWWMRYLLPPGGVVLDPFAGSGSSLVAALDHGASRVIGIEREAQYVEIARRRIENG